MFKITYTMDNGETLEIDSGNINDFLYPVDAEKVKDTYKNMRGDTTISPAYFEALKEAKYGSVYVRDFVLTNPLDVTSKLQAYDLLESNHVFNPNEDVVDIYNDGGITRVRFYMLGLDIHSSEKDTIATNLDTLSDYAACRITKKQWLDEMSKSDSGLVLDHPLIERAKFFCTTPVTLAFWVEDGELKSMPALTAMYQKADGSSVDFNPDQDILYAIQANGFGSTFFRMAKTGKDLV